MPVHQLQPKMSSLGHPSRDRLSSDITAGQEIGVAYPLVHTGLMKSSLTARGSEVVSFSLNIHFFVSAGKSTLEVLFENWHVTNEARSRNARGPANSLNTYSEEPTLYTTPDRRFDLYGLSQ